MYPYQDRGIDTPIPGFDPVTGYLPPGLYLATIDEIGRRLGFTQKRHQLIASLELAVRWLFDAGVTDLRIDGSFVTEKPEPGDIDGFWVMDDNVRLSEIPPILLDFSTVPDPASGKLKFPMWFQLGIELYVHPLMGGFQAGDLPEFFSHSRDGIPRGYIQVLPSGHAIGERS